LGREGKSSRGGKSERPGIGEEKTYRVKSIRARKRLERKQQPKTNAANATGKGVDKPEKAGGKGDLRTLVSGFFENAPAKI